MTDPLLDAIEATRTAVLDNQAARWIVAYSGGKDSTAALKILLSACRGLDNPPKIEVIYCDTGVENPLLDAYVQDTLGALNTEAEREFPNLECHILRAPVQQRFFVKIIGRGYPPPTNNFRWCTSYLRIRPVARYIQDAAVDDAIVVLGMRRSESQQRDRSLGPSTNLFQYQREGSKSYRLFLPILNLDVAQVWDAVFSLGRPRCIQASTLEYLYRGASGECPVIKAPEAPPCASGRFGCWTCTVVRKDKSAIALIESGEISLVPYHDFRNWLAEIRNDAARRWPRRRNGSAGSGPFNIGARKEIFDRLSRLSQVVGRQLVSDDEVREIERLWALDEQVDAEFVAASNY